MITTSENGKVSIDSYPSLNDDRWTPIRTHKNYFIHPSGYVKSVKHFFNKRRRELTTRQKILSMFTRDGYLSVNMVETIGGAEHRRSAAVHILVAEAFIGERPIGCDVMHLDGNRSNASAENLRYGSRKCNEAFKIDHGTALIGSNNHRAKLNEDDVIKIRESLASGCTGVDMAKKYNVTPSTIGRIKRRNTWTCI